jgi:hypothetical protein
MNGLQDLLDRQARRVTADPGALHGVLRRADRRRRTRRAATAIFALVLAALALGSVMRAIERSEPRPAVPPTITPANVSELEMAWTAAEPGGCCPTATVSGDRVYVAGKEGVSAYPIDCGASGITCRPIWFGEIEHVRYYLAAPIADGDMVFAADHKTLYAFPADCAEDGRTCGPSWFAPHAGRIAVSAPAVGGGLVFVGTGKGIEAYPVHCGIGGSTCEPVWVGRHASNVPTVADGVVYDTGCPTIYSPCAATKAHRIFAWSTECIAARDTCEPLWFGLVPGVPAYPSPPTVAGGYVYVGSGDQVSAFPVGCRSDGGRCDPSWVGDTGETGGGRVQSLATDGELVIAGTTTSRRGHLYSGSPGNVYAFPTSCGSTVCSPIWMTHVDGDPWLTARNGLVFIGTYGGTLSAYEASCIGIERNCSPVWRAKTFDGGLIFDHVTMSDSAVCAGGDTGQVYCFAVPPP